MENSYSYETAYSIPLADDCFMFYYDDNMILNFEVPKYPG